MTHLRLRRGLPRPARALLLAAAPAVAASWATARLMLRWQRFHAPADPAPPEPPAPADPPAPAGEPPAAPGPVLAPALLADIATAQWRAQRRMVPEGAGEPEGRLRPVHRQVRTTLELLAEAGVEVQGHDGEDFVDGRRLHVVAFQDVPGLDRPRVLETVRPGVYVRGELVQTAEVIVGRPEADGGEEGGTDGGEEGGTDDGADGEGPAGGGTGGPAGGVSTEEDRGTASEGAA